MSDDYKDIIKIPESLDNAILKGLEDGKRKKTRNNKIRIAKRVTKVASIFIVSISLIAVINPKLASAIPIVSSIFEYISSNNSGESVNKYENSLDDVNIDVEKNGVKINLNKLAIDDNILVATFYIESDKLAGYDLSKPAGDFMNLEMNMTINGESPSSYGATVSIVNENKGAVMIEANVSNIDLEEDINIQFDINQIVRSGKKIASGPWKMNINTVKGINSKVYLSDEFINIKGETLYVDKLMVTPLTNTLFIKGKCDNNMFEDEYIIRDNYGNILTYNFEGGSADQEGNYKAQIKILNDLSSLKYIEIIKSEGNKTTRKEIGGFSYNLLKATVVNEEAANRLEEVISREPTKEEINSGFGLDKVTYWVNIDKHNSFQSLSDLVGKEIRVNSTDKVTITNIESTDEHTKITMKIDGAYNYNLLTSLVVFDEDMKDTAHKEGEAGSVLEDAENKVVSITLDAIDKNKKYTIAVPTTTDLKLDEDSKITINLNK